MVLIVSRRCSMWLPDYCVVGANTLERVAAARRAPRSAASLRGLGVAAAARF
jgi:hypothetical protein